MKALTRAAVVVCSLGVTVSVALGAPAGATTTPSGRTHVPFFAYDLVVATSPQGSGLGSAVGTRHMTGHSYAPAHLRPAAKNASTRIVPISGRAAVGPTTSARSAVSSRAPSSDAASVVAAERAIPALRQAYVDDVASISDNVAAWEKAGADAEFIAREAWADRRALGIQYKGLTPPDVLEQITARNIAKYGDPLGPSIDWLRAQGKTWQQIIESATRSGGRDLGF